MGPHKAGDVIRLTLMSAFDTQIDHGQQCPIADLVVKRWFDTGVSTRFVRASSNFVASVRMEHRTYFLRFNHESERGAGAYAAEMAFVEHLATRGIRVARPVRSKAGALVERVPTQMGTFHAVILEAMPGEAHDLMALDETALWAWGRAMAGMHAAAEGYTADGRPDWREHLTFARQTIPAAENAAHKELAFVQRALGALPRDATRFGMIHFDMEADNVRWQDGVPGIFDFDDCAYSWFAADVAYALRDLYQDKIQRIDLADRRLRAFVTGYRSARPLLEDALRRLPLFLRLHNLFWFARLHRAIADGVVPRAAPWMTALRRKLVRKQDEYRKGFDEHPVCDYLG
jgi:Ser/Thr protein kinase RdoA (MazF antagonist)